MAEEKKLTPQEQKIRDSFKVKRGDFSKVTLEYKDKKLLEK